MIRVFLVDDHPIVRHGFVQLLSGQPDLEVCGQASDARGALDALVAAAPDVVLVDISLGATSGIELIGDIKAQLPGAAVLVVSMHDEQLYAERSLRAGASGYVMKHEATEAIVRAIRNRRRRRHLRQRGDVGAPVPAVGRRRRPRRGLAARRAQQPRAPRPSS